MDAAQVQASHDAAVAEALMAAAIPAHGVHTPPNIPTFAWMPAQANVGILIHGLSKGR